MRVAIIDSGVDSNHRRLDSCVISGVSISLDGDSTHFSCDFQDALGHGTACAAIIHRLVPTAQLVAVKIFHDQLLSDEKTLCMAMRWSIDNGVDLINMSLGVTTDNPSPEMYTLCEEASQRNIPLVAAANPYDAALETYPAYFPSVFGVMAGHIKKRYGFGYRPNSPLQFIAKGTTQRLASRNGEFTIGSGTSYACAHFTGIVAEYMSREQQGLWNIEDLKQKIIEDADQDIQPLQNSVESDGNDGNMNTPVIARHDLEKEGRRLFLNQSKVSWIGRAALFPASEKEMNAFLRFPKLCSCEMMGYFDFPQKITGVPDSDRVYNRLPRAEEYNEFDTMVIGYYYDNPFEGNIKFGHNLILEMIKKNKNIYVFDLDIKEELKKEVYKFDYRGLIYVPIVNDKTYEELMRFRYLPKIKVPVLAVIGTSSRQGKFTTQLRLREILEDSGYKVSHVSTEPQGELLGAEFTFHYGHKSGTVRVPLEKWTPLLRSITKGIQEFNNPDIILTGTQGGTVPRRSDYSNSTISLEYLFGVQPDVVICAINPQDSLELVEANMHVAEIYCKAKTILFTMTPWLRNYTSIKGQDRYVARNRMLEPEEIKEKLTYFQDALPAPVIDVMDKSNDEMILQLVQESFS